MVRCRFVQCHFYSHASCEARRLHLFYLWLFIQFLLTRLLRGATRAEPYHISHILISTHTPLARRDTHWPHGISIQSSFLLTRLLRGATVARYIMKKHLGISTHTPLARRDHLKLCSNLHLLHFYSHASCEARRSTGLLSSSIQSISTHTPLARRDNGTTVIVMDVSRFLLTRLLRGATAIFFQFISPEHISTHTPLARRDFLEAFLCCLTVHFYSHASCEARPKSVNFPSSVINFYSHASCEARLQKNAKLQTERKFLLTRLLRGATESF